MHRPDPPPTPLLDYLTGRPAAASNPGWRLERRRGEGGPWEVVGRPPSRALALDEMAAPAFAWSAGDVVVLRSAAGTARGTWIGTPRAMELAGPVPSDLGGGADWARAWERPDALAGDMAGVAAFSGVDRRRLALAVVACARSPLVPNALPDDMIDALARWARGEGAAAEVRALVAGVAPGAPDPRRSPFVAPPLAWIAANLAADGARGDGREVEVPAEVVLDALVTYARGWGRERGDEFARLAAAIVRRHVPLAVLLLARAGEPTPPSLVL